jgi:hypothetical protein
MSGIRELRQIRHRGSPRLLIIQAASGAGKSSFLRAGLWPKLGRTSEFVPLCVVRPAKGVITGHSGIGHGLANWFTQHKRARAAGTIHAELMAEDAEAGSARLAQYFAEAVELAAGERALETTTDRPSGPRREQLDYGNVGEPTRGMTHRVVPMGHKLSTKNVKLNSYQVVRSVQAHGKSGRKNKGLDAKWSDMRA